MERGKKKISPSRFSEGGTFFSDRANFKRYFWVIYVVAFTCKESAFPLEAINPMSRNCPVGAFIFFERVEGKENFCQRVDWGGVDLII